MTRHFLDIAGHQADDLRSILENAKSIKAVRQQVAKDRPLDGKILAMIFDKPSTRTRVSFDVGMRQLGGETIVMDGSSSQLGKGETVADTARVLSRYVDAIMIRTTAHERLLEMAEHATVPVINALTDDTHPCQIMADVMTYEEHRGSITGKTVAWTGDGNNVLSSFLEAGALLDFKVRAATPESRGPDDRYVKWARDNGGDFELFHNADQAVAGADCVVTDKWLSMGQEDDGVGHNTFAPYQVNEALMAKADKDALFMHCLPAHRGEEVTAAVMDGPQSVVFDEAENRLHAQKSILTWCLAPDYTPPQV
mgnify:CR=1 FL=1